MSKTTSSATAKLDARRKVQITLEKRPNLKLIEKAKNLNKYTESILEKYFDK